MQVPERLALIGGSILLSSTLIFTLKSQASQILPKISDSASKIYDHIGDAQKSSDFNGDFQQAQKNGEITGTWGNAKYYIDKDMNMHVGAGRLDAPIFKVLSDQDLHSIKTINFDQPVQAPADSTGLLAGKNLDKGADADNNDSITAINGLGNMDVSQVTNMNQMFYRDFSLSNNLDIGNWDTSNVISMDGIFGRTGLNSLNLANWDVSKVQDLGHAFLNSGSLKSIDLHNWHPNNAFVWMDHVFAGDSSLESLDISNLDTSNANMNMAFGGDNISSTDEKLSKLSLGEKTYFMNYSGLSATWKNGDQTIQGDQFPYSNTNQSGHPGTWVKQ